MIFQEYIWRYLILGNFYFKCVINIFVNSITIPHDILPAIIKIKIQIKFFSYHLTKSLTYYLSFCEK